MPIYCYRAVDVENACDTCRESYEIKQKFDEPALTVCPQCGEKMEKLIVPFFSYTSKKDLLSNKKLSQMGFTKLVKEEPGKYRKVT